MDSLEKRLDPAEFARVSRSSLVRVAAIREVRLSEDAIVHIAGCNAIAHKHEYPVK